MSHLVDTSVWHKYQRFPAVKQIVDDFDADGAVLTTCPTVIAEYCFSATNATSLQEFQSRISLLRTIESANLAHAVRTIQMALWSQGLVRAAGAIDTLTAAYALESDQTLVTCDADHLHISRALGRFATRERLRVLYIAENGEVTRAAS